jgi:serine/threonine protein phosphatase PrpC
MSDGIRHFTWNGQTHRGRVRSNNEDAFLAMMFDAHEMRYLGKVGEAPADDSDFIFAVSDGMGGAKKGEYASKTALQTLTDLICRKFHRGKTDSDLDKEAVLKEFFQAVHEGVQNVGRYYEECRGMGATLSICWFSGDHLLVGHVGDSRVYHFPAAGGLNQLTDDHTVPGRLRREGKLSEREARNHPNKHLLERSIGAQPDPVEPQVVTIRFKPGDRFALCTDGVVDGIWDQSMERYIQNPPPYLVNLPPAQRLIKEAMEASGRDNLTALVVETK